MIQLICVVAVMAIAVAAFQIGRWIEFRKTITSDVRLLWRVSRYFDEAKENIHYHSDFPSDMKGKKLVIGLPPAGIISKMVEPIVHMTSEDIIPKELTAKQADFKNLIEQMNEIDKEIKIKQDEMMELEMERADVETKIELHKSDE